MPVFTDYPTIKQTSLNDILGPLSSIQQYQQAQQLNPIQLEAARLQLEQAKQMNPLALQEAQLKLQQAQAATPTAVLKSGIEGQVLDQTNQERKALMEFQKNPDNWSTNGRVDIDKLNKAVPLIAPLTGADHIEKITKLGEAQTKSLEAKQKLTQSQREIIANRFGVLGRLGLEDPKVVVSEMERLKKENPDNKDLADVADAYSDVYKMTKPGPHVAADLVRASQSMLSPSQQQETLSRKAGTADIGGQIVGTQATPDIGGIPPTIAFGQTLANKTLAPQTYTTETGAPGVIGGGNRGPLPQGAALPTGRPGSSQNITGAFEAKGGLQRAPDETYDAYKARTARLSALPAKANIEMNMANRDSVPNQEYTNNKILKILEKPNVDIGPVADAIAKKTGGIGLNSDQQEVIKYLEQRIRQEAARTNQDQSSQRSAYGSFGTSKPALLDILYNDKGLLASQRLYNQGLIKNQGDPNKPNLAKINKFENDFNQLNDDPNVSHLLGVIGKKSLQELTTSDRQHLKKAFGDMSAEEINKLFDKKEKLEKLVSGE
jgi:hypothetical protein